MAKHADAFQDDSFDAEDSFLDDAAMTPVSDPFLDASAVERRMLGEPDPSASKAAPDPAGLRPFGARLAEANQAPEPDFAPARQASAAKTAPAHPRRPPRVLWRRWRQWTGFMARLAAMRMTR